MLAWQQDTTGVCQPFGSATHHRCAADFAHTIERGALEASIRLSHHHHINCSCHVGGYLEQSAARRQGIDLQVQQDSACSTTLFAVSGMQVKLNARAGTEYTISQADVTSMAPLSPRQQQTLGVGAPLWLLQLG